MKCKKEYMKLYAVTDRMWTGRQTLMEQVEDALKGGVTCVQLREKELDEESFLQEAYEMKALCEKYGVPFFINDNVKIAIACHADGVHVGQEDWDPVQVRKAVGPDMWIGVTAKTVEQALAAQKAGADYLTIHLEADTPENTMVALEKIAAMGVKPAISVRPGTSAEAVKPYLNKVAMILVMTVEPGFGGQGFMYDMMPKLKAIRRMCDEVNPDCLLEVDGGVDLKTASICKENGASVLVTGSAYFGASDRKQFVEAIEN